MRFGMSEKPTMDCVSLYNNVGFIYKVFEEIASENAENCRYRQPHNRLMSHLKGTPANIRINLARKQSHWSLIVTLVLSLHLF